MNDIPIVDSHIHYWDTNVLQYNWLKEVPELDKSFLPEDLANSAINVNLTDIVFVQADCHPSQALKEVEWVTQLRNEEKRINAIVAFAPLEHGLNVAQDLHELSLNPLVKGIRRIIQSESPGFCLKPDFINGVQLLPKYDFSFDICIVHYQLDDAIKLVEKCPEVSFVLDHVGKPDIKNRVFDSWSKSIDALASYSNVYCKISDLVSAAGKKLWSPKAIQPYIEHIIDAYGTDRVMYGGDWPPSLLSTTYQTWIESLDKATTMLSKPDIQKLFNVNAKNFYRLS